MMLSCLILILNDHKIFVVSNDTSDELGITCLCIPFQIEAEEFVSDTQASRASVSVVEALEHIPSVPGTSQHIPSQGSP